jgi:hypothetical protein
MISPPSPRILPRTVRIWRNVPAPGHVDLVRAALDQTVENG